MAEFDLFKEVDAAWHRLTQYPGPDYDKPSFRMGFEACAELLGKLGWHPASELPPLDENGDSGCVVGVWEEQEFSPFITIPLPVSGYVSYQDGEWTKPIKWWCYPPRKEE